TGRGPMKTQGFEARFSQNLAPVSLVKPQNPYLAYISHLFSRPYLEESDQPDGRLSKRKSLTRDFHRSLSLKIGIWVQVPGSQNV
ncbi:hypothetical protein PN467_00465, partial [Microcystis aeruginosa CS-563/04]|uniref:hypothetical protein n=1 Tax=Microcystis aeruginosa TaxID=1126 RepID=UPI00232C5DA5